MLKTSPAEEFLFKEGLVMNRSITRRKMLGCIGCKLAQAANNNERETVYGAEIRKCKNLGNGTVGSLLSMLESAELFIQSEEQGFGIDWAKKLYLPGTTPQAIEFRKLLLTDPICTARPVQLSANEALSPSEVAKELREYAVGVRRSKIKQAVMARRLGISQARLSEIERNAEIPLTTFIRYIQELDLEITISEKTSPPSE